MKQLVLYQQKRNRTLIDLFYKLLCCFILCVILSCRNTDEIIVYYKVGFVNSPISLSCEEFEKEADRHLVDTVIFITKERFDRYGSMLKEANIIDSDSENIHNYFINIKCEDINIALPLPNSLNGKIITYTGNGKQLEISDVILFDLLCAARYFDFFKKEELNSHPLVKKFNMPSGYVYYFERQSDIPRRIKSRHKVVLKVE